jgi:hypothetical protein
MSFLAMCSSVTGQERGLGPGGAVSETEPYVAQGGDNAPYDCTCTKIEIKIEGQAVVTTPFAIDEVREGTVKWSINGNPNAQLCVEVWTEPTPEKTPHRLPSATFQWQHRSGEPFRQSDRFTTNCAVGERKFKIKGGPEASPMVLGSKMIVQIYRGPCPLPKPVTRPESICPAADIRFTVLKVELNKVLSDQFSGADVNRLPPIGVYPDKNKPMLMGCASYVSEEGMHMAKIKVEATVTPSSSTAYVGIRKVGTTATLDSDVINSGGQTALSWSSSDNDAVYEVIGGIDQNENDFLDPSEVCTTYPDHVRVFNIIQYNNSSDYLSLAVVGGAFVGYPTAAALLEYFLDNSGNETTVSLTHPRLYHPIGIQWSGTSGPCSKYNFANLSDVVQAKEFHQRLGEQAIADHYLEMFNYFTAHPGSTHTFGPWSCSLPDFNFPNSGDHSVDFDMFYAFALVDSFTVTSYQMTMHDSGNFNYDVLSITAEGSFKDLYDFDIWAGGFSEPAAKVQAGYPTLGTAGRVFQVDKVNFNGTWNSP